MVLKAAIIISVVSIVMLTIYGVDSIMAISENRGIQNTAFLNIDVKTRGEIFGIIPAAMLIISFFVTRKEPSRNLGILIAIGGALMIIGIGIIFALQGNAITSEGKREFGAVVSIGIIIIIVGGIKIKKSSNINLSK
jgi:hypothetical protein